MGGAPGAQKNVQRNPGRANRYPSPQPRCKPVALPNPESRPPGRRPLFTTAPRLPIKVQPLKPANSPKSARKKPGRRARAPKKSALVLFQKPPRGAPGGSSPAVRSPPAPAHVTNGSPVGPRQSGSSFSPPGTTLVSPPPPPPPPRPHPGFPRVRGAAPPWPPPAPGGLVSLFTVPPPPPPTPGPPKGFFPKNRSRSRFFSNFLLSPLPRRPPPNGPQSPVPPPPFFEAPRFHPPNPRAGSWT